MKPAVSVITPWMNTPELIDDYERCVKRSGVEVITVNNGKDDYSLRGMTDRLKGIYITNPFNHGFAIANNQGLRMAQGEIIVFLNSDVYGDPSWLDKVVRDVKEPGLYGPLVHACTSLGVEVWYVSGYCVGASRKTWDQLGGWCPKFKKPYYEDTYLGALAQSFYPCHFQTRWKIGHKGSKTSIKNSCFAHDNVVVYKECLEILFKEKGMFLHNKVHQI